MFRPSLLLLTLLLSVTALGQREELSTGASDPTLNYINWAQRRYTFIRGAGIGILIKERAFDTADIDFRGRVVNTGLQSAVLTSHAALMATLAAGGANTSPYARGVAPAARLGSAAFTNLYPEADALLKKDSLSILNHSYGTGIEAFYGAEARAYDSQVVRLPYLLPVFSAGNSGANGAGSITGNFKWARNGLVVGAQDSSGAVVSISSRGPAPDGRIKPELVAFGEDGASGAAALVSGTAALLSEAYKRERGALPPSSLLRAALINGATDLGPEGPDYTSGWGALHAEAALSSILQQRWLLDSLTAGGVYRLPLQVPPGTAVLKVTLSWIDPNGARGTAGRLQENLDLKLVQPATGGEWLPWTLSPDDPVRRTQDTINNNEQVTLRLPAPGAYEVEVSRKGGGAGLQSFALVWSAASADSLSITYPTAADPLPAGRTVRLRWTTAATGTGRLSYRINGGAWTDIHPSVPLEAQQWAWAVPDTGGQAQLRLRMPVSGLEYLSDTFAIAAQPELEAGYNCGDSLLLQWKGIKGADGYRLYRLEDRYLQPLIETRDTTVVLKGALGRYYAVAPIQAGVEGLRSYTVLVQEGTAGCYLNAFYLEGQEGRKVLLRAALGTLRGVTSAILLKETPAGLRPLDSIARPLDRSFSLTDPQIAGGENRYRLRLRLEGGGTVLSEVVVAYGLAEGQAALIYPSPARSGTEVKVLSLEAGKYSITILDATGRIIWSRMLNSTITTLPALPAGLYFARFNSQSGPAGTQSFLIR